MGDVSNLPFEYMSFDHIVYRFGVMFFPDMEKGTREKKRVLKPKGKVAVGVWAAPDLNPHISLMASGVMQKPDLPKPPPEAPGIFKFKCAKPGLLKRLFSDPGLKNVNETNVKAKITFDSPEQYWQGMSNVAGPIMQVLEKAPKDLKKEAKDSVIKKSEDFIAKGKLQLAGEAIIVSGKKE